MSEIKLKCPAKLNLNLSVLRKRLDGMHEIKTQFQLINLFDELFIKKTTKNSPISVKTNLETSIDDENNIVFKAIKALSDHADKELYCDVKIKKNIPLGGGLGGGSSNAAAALIGVNFLFKLGLLTSSFYKTTKKQSKYVTGIMARLKFNSLVWFKVGLDYAFAIGNVIANLDLYFEF